jgi:prephenate dehydratase
MKIAYQGEPGAFSCDWFDAVFEAVTSAKAEAGLIPIENSLAGSIHQNYDLLLHHQLWITGEYFLRVRHCLIGLPGVRKSDIGASSAIPRHSGSASVTCTRWPGSKRKPSKTPPGV